MVTLGIWMKSDQWFICWGMNKHCNHLHFKACGNNKKCSNIYVHYKWQCITQTCLWTMKQLFPTQDIYQTRRTHLWIPTRSQAQPCKTAQGCLNSCSRCNPDRAAGWGFSLHPTAFCKHFQTPQPFIKQLFHSDHHHPVCQLTNKLVSLDLHTQTCICAWNADVQMETRTKRSSNLSQERLDFTTASICVVLSADYSPPLEISSIHFCMKLLCHVWDVEGIFADWLVCLQKLRH